MNYYILDPDGTTIYRVGSSPGVLQRYHPGATVLSTTENIVRVDGKLYLESQAPPPAPPTVEELTAKFVAAIQKRLDDFAGTRGYDSIFTAATYAASGNARFAAEGQYAVRVRDETWATAYQILDEVLAGGRPMPTIEEVMAELPALAWPEPNPESEAETEEAPAPDDYAGDDDDGEAA